MAPVTDTGLIRLQTIWKNLFPTHKLEIGGFFPKVKRIETPDSSYRLRQMSDGERTILYMLARVLTADGGLILVDEPELHMHSRLATKFWDEAEKLRPDCRFAYITHDLHFALSRRRARFLVVKPDSTVQEVLLSDVPSSIASDVLGAATLPFYARRVVLFEGAPGQGFAGELFGVWFDDGETFAIAAGGRDAVCAAVAGLKSVGVTSAEIVGVVDRDFYSDEALVALPDGVRVLSLHEIESVLCDRRVVDAIAAHLGKDRESVWTEFVGEVRKSFRGRTLSHVVASRVRARVVDLLDGAFHRAQIDEDCDKTAALHKQAMAELGIEARVGSLFDEESKRVSGALDQGGTGMLAMLPGKHLLSLLAVKLGLGSQEELTGLVIRALDRKHLGADDPMVQLGQRLERALEVYLPPRGIGRAEPRDEDSRV
jgi:hypothetical protein